MKPKIRMYIANWSLYFVWRAEAKQYWNYKAMTLREKFRFQFGWASIFVNMVTGGDPRETTSSSVHKDRDSSWFAAALIWVIELFHKNHGEVAYQAHFGEDSPDNRELKGPIRVVLLVLWCLVLYLGGWRLPLYLWYL